MSFKPRMSMAPPSSQQKIQGRKKEDESDAFMRLPDAEIAGCISDIGVPFTAADLQKPNPLQIQQIFQWFAELLMNATPETVAPAMRAAAEDVCGEYMDIIPADVRNLMGFYASLRKLLIECGVNDFSFQDLQKPTYERLSKIFSYIINFVRFRESQTAVIDEHFNKAETRKMRTETLYMENQEMEAAIEEMKQQMKAMEIHVAQKTKRNAELKQQLRGMLESQTALTARHANLQKRKIELTTELEDKTAHTISLRQESAKLRPYVLQSASALQSSLTDLSNTLATDKASIDSLDRRARALQTSTDTFAVVSTDVGSCIKIFEEISTELSKEEDENGKNARQRDALSERSNNVREVERQESLLQRQLTKYNERTEKLREGSREKAQAANERMIELRAVHRKLTEERSEKSREMERRRVRIEQTEKKMVDLKENIENEIHNAHDEFLKMDSHIKLYITEMEQSL